MKKNRLIVLCQKNHLIKKSINRLPPLANIQSTEEYSSVPSTALGLWKKIVLEYVSNAYFSIKTGLNVYICRP